MANFFLIDPSLTDASGHHFDYAQCVARAANEMGFHSTIATNRRLPNCSLEDPHSLDCLGDVRRVFQNSIYHRDSYLTGLQRMARKTVPSPIADPKAGWLKKLKLRFGFYQHWRRRENLIRQFAVDCERAFTDTLLTAQDHVFCTTVSEIELMGLALFLSHHPRTTSLQWHLQFHYNLFSGRPPEYQQQSQTLKSVRSCFQAALARASYHAIHFYTTSDELTQQYNRLDIAPFQTLPYPVGREFAPLVSTCRKNSPTILKFSEYQSQPSSLHNESVSASPLIAADAETSPIIRLPDRFESTETDFQNLNDSSDDPFRTTSAFPPLRIVLPGGVRREKGQSDYLQPLVDEIYQPWLATGRAQLVLQRPQRSKLQRQKIELKIPVATTETVSSGASLVTSPIVYAPHPLPRDEYLDLIRSADIGLLFYDSETYYSRRAGVLGELLSVGKPVIVPAGCWLAEQIQEPIFQHADRQLATGKPTRRTLADLNWQSQNVPMPGGVCSFDAGRRPFVLECDLTTQQSLVGFRFDWHWPNEPGIYCTVELTQFRENDQIIESAKQTVGHRDGDPSVALFSLSSETKRLKFSLTNAFHNSTASIKEIEVVTVEDSSGRNNPESSRPTPIGAVGVIASNRDHLASCVGELIEHFDHYQATAAAFAPRWYAHHDPKRTVARLIRNEVSRSEAA